MWEGHMNLILISLGAIFLQIGMYQQTHSISDELHAKLIQQISVQRNFDQKPLTTRICWQCGRVLWGDGSSKASYLVDPPEGMHSKHAPVNTFLKAVDKCNLTFEHDGKEAEMVFVPSVRLVRCQM